MIEKKRMILRLGLKADLPILAVSEFGFCSDTGELYIGSSAGNVQIAAGITTEMIASWDTAYGWGDHSGLYDADGEAASERAGHEAAWNHNDFLAAAPKLDDCQAPDDTTDLDASTDKHGLCPKLSGDAGEFLNGGGGFSAPSAGGVELVRNIGSGVMISNDTEQIADSTNYSKLKEIAILEDSPGDLTVYWTHTSADGRTVRTRLYINGVAQGTEKTTTDTDGVEVNQAWTTDLNNGDLIQIYGKVDNAGNQVYVRNMALKYSWSVASFGGHELVTPLPTTDTTAISTVNQDP
jgi:hypothetical protein